MAKVIMGFQFRCMGCNMKLVEGDLFYPDVSGGYLHAECCGTDPDLFVDDDLNPLKPGDPLPEPSVWRE